MSALVDLLVAALVAATIMALLPFAALGLLARFATPPLPQRWRRAGDPQVMHKPANETVVAAMTNTLTLQVMQSRGRVAMLARAALEAALTPEELASWIRNLSNNHAAVAITFMEDMVGYEDEDDARAAG